MSCSVRSCLDALRVYWCGLRRKTHRTGCFPATGGIRHVIRSRPRFFGLPASALHNALGWNTSTSIPTPYATALPLICSKLALTCAPSRCC